MAQGYGQKDLISKQRELESKPTEKLPVKEGAIIEFVDTPQFNGIVRRISKDQWQTVFIDYGSEGKSKIIHGYEIISLYQQEKIVVKKLPAKVGLLVEFVDEPEYNGRIEKIAKDQWQTVYINYGNDDELKPIRGYDFLKMVESGKIIIKKK
ncbi:MAG: hypothetical protein Q8942_03380 [Bacillota bacterium]|nr:hypothetical protein [Bacillota bacterium]